MHHQDWKLPVNTTVTVDIPQMTLDDLLQQVADTRGPEELAGRTARALDSFGSWWAGGRPGSTGVQRCAINSFAHSRATVDGVRLHSCTSAAGARDDSHRSGTG
jgi:hypothetical protein